MDIISDYTVTAIIHAPIEKINLSEWLFTLKEQEYQACSVGHLGAGISSTHDGKRISLNVELVGGSLLVQHYVEDISLKNQCRVNSISDSISAMGNTKLGVTWELNVKKSSPTACEFSNRVKLFFTEEFISLLHQANITDFEPVKQSMSKNVIAHNEEETPLFAKDIEQKALSGIWD